MPTAEENEQNKAWIGVACLSISAFVAMMMLARGDTTPSKAPAPPVPPPRAVESDGCRASIAPPDSARMSDLPVLATRPTKILAMTPRSEASLYGSNDVSAWGLGRYVDVRGDVYSTRSSAFANVSGAPQILPRDGFDVELCGTREYLGTLRRQDLIDLAAALDHGRHCGAHERGCPGVAVPTLVEGDRIVLERIDARTPHGATAMRIYKYIFEL